MTLGLKITTLRKQKKCSQAHLSRATGISRDAVSKYERDEMIPSIENAKKIADFLGVSLDYLASPEVEVPVLDPKMRRRMQELHLLDEADRETILAVVDAFIRDAKTRQAYGT